MEYKEEVSFKLGQKRHRRSLKSKKKRKSKRFRLDRKNVQLKKILGSNYSYADVLAAFLPKNLKYLVFECDFSPIRAANLANSYTLKNSDLFLVPENFSLITNADASYKFVQDVASALILQSCVNLVIDYRNCKNISLEAQIFLDIILKDIITFYKRCREYKKLRPQLREIKGDNVNNSAVRKMLWSIGSPAIHTNSA